MRRLLIVLLFLAATTFNVSAAEMEFNAPTVPKTGTQYLHDTPESFSEGLQEILDAAIPEIRFACAEAAAVCVRITGIILLLSLIEHQTGVSKSVVRLVGAMSLTTVFLSASETMLPMGESTVQELSSYGKLLLPVMTGALAAQGNVTTSGTFYAGTAFFDAFLCGIISKILIPLTYAFLAMSVAAGALEESFLGKVKDTMKGIVSWILKILLYVFTGYMTITGAVSGSTDAMAMKAAKVTISSVVPVVGGILSDASEAVLVSASVMKNAAGIYGILAVLAITVGPFLRLGAQYILLKLTASLCGPFGNKTLSGLVNDFSTAMGLVLAMTVSVSLMLLISLVCFLKVVA